MSKLRKQVQEMANLSVLSNRISEVHEFNLTRYPFVFFNDVRSVWIDYDVSRAPDGQMQVEHPDHHVTYHIDLDENSNKDHLNKRISCLKDATRVLFWNDLTVNVIINGRILPESK